MRVFPASAGVATCWLAALASAAPASAQAQPVDAATFTARLRPLLERHCLECHDTATRKADLDLERFTDLASAGREPAIWQRVRDQIDSGAMPPRDAEQPSTDERAALRQLASDFVLTLAAPHAGDPGPVVLRRLCNAEYAYAIADLTGVAAIDPTREFPADGAAGEGFTNVGNALAMSPMLFDKYLAAAKTVAAHALLLPDGIAFSAANTRRDQTEELLARIREFYWRHCERGEGGLVDLQGIPVRTDGGGRLPLQRYLEATLALRGLADVDAEQIATEAGNRGLQAKYLTTLWQALHADEGSPPLADLRSRWRTASAADAPALVAAIAAWQAQLWQFHPVGHIGKVGGPRAWLEPALPLAATRELRLALPAAPTDEVVVHLVASGLGGPAGADVVRWRNPRLVAAGRPDLPLPGIQDLVVALQERRAAIVATAAKCLQALADGGDGHDLDPLAQQHGVPAALLRAWAGLLGVTATEGGAFALLDQPVRAVGGNAVVNGFASGELPSLVTNAGDAPLRIPGQLAAHGVAVHPAPGRRVVVAWRSPITATMPVTAVVQHVHTDCGNGVAWSLELRRNALRLRLAAGEAVDATPQRVRVDDVPILAGDRVVVVVAARGADHTCDLTAIDLELGDAGPAHWRLAAQIADDVLAGNPHADHQGTPGVWEFGHEADPEPLDRQVLPLASGLGRWLAAAQVRERVARAPEVAARLRDGAGADAADATLRATLLAADGPFCRDILASHVAGATAPMAVRAPSTTTFRVPAELAAGRELVVTGELDPDTGREGAVQLECQIGPEPIAGGLRAAPIIVADGSVRRSQLAAQLTAFGDLFPAALCYAQIVPVDEVVTLTLFHREDRHLIRLLLEPDAAAELERLWAALHFVSQDALTLVDVFEQLWQYATQDADPKVFEPLREPILARAAAFRATLAAAEPRHRDAVAAFAARAWRRPLAADDATQLQQLYERLRRDGVDHEPAIRLLLARVLAAPAFLYRSEAPGPGATPTTVGAHELATRLSFFLWSSVPDAELLALADQDRLRDPEVLVAQARRLLADPRARRLALEFGCTWLHLRDFDPAVEKSERHFPGFVDLRAAMREEVVHLFAEVLQHDRPVLELLDADHTFVNGALARHYGIDGIDGPEWRRVDGMRARGRGGVLATAAVLSAQSGASRTSPILRGNWIGEVLLGDRLPRPPADVPKLPEDEAEEALTMRELVERHRRDPRCASCHDRIDPLGLPLEGFDAIGRRRTQDLGGRAIDTRTTTLDGTAIADFADLRRHLATTRRDAFLRQCARKLLGYALGRAVQLGDEPLLAAILAAWPQHGFRSGFLIEQIVRSPQFQQVRGRDHGAVGKEER